MKSRWLKFQSFGLYLSTSPTSIAYVHPVGALIWLMELIVTEGLRLCQRSSINTINPFKGKAEGWKNVFHKYWLQWRPWYYYRKHPSILKYSDTKRRRCVLTSHSKVCYVAFKYIHVDLESRQSPSLSPLPLVFHTHSPILQFNYYLLLRASHFKKVLTNSKNCSR